MSVIERDAHHAPTEVEAIAQHGRPALCRTSGICSTVLGRMLAYEPDQRFKPETWAKLESGIKALNVRAAPDPARTLR